MRSKRYVWLGFSLSLTLSACVVEDPAPLPRREQAELTIDETMVRWEHRFEPLPQQCWDERARIQLVQFERSDMDVWCQAKGVVGCFHTTPRHWPVIAWAHRGFTDEYFAGVITHESLHWLLQCSGRAADADADHSDKDVWALCPI